MAQATARSRLWRVAAGVATLLLVAFAAGAVGWSRHRQRETARRVAAQVREWHRQLVTEMPAPAAAAWEAAASRQPVELLRGCANERLTKPGEAP